MERPSNPVLPGNSAGSACPLAGTGCQYDGPSPGCTTTARPRIASVWLMDVAPDVWAWHGPDTLPKKPARTQLRSPAAPPAAPHERPPLVILPAAGDLEIPPRVAFAAEAGSPDQRDRGVIHRHNVGFHAVQAEGAESVPQR